MFEFVAGVFALGVVAQIAFWVVAVVLFPLFWVWMLVDAALRPEPAFTSGTNEKVLWIVFMLLFQVTSIVYFVVVYRKAVRRADVAEQGAGPSPATPTAHAVPSAGM